MHTVREALDRGRSVFAVPGPLGVRSSEGTNQLIREGAAPCLGVDDVLDEVWPGHQVLQGTLGGGAGQPGAEPAGQPSRRPPSGRAAEVLAAIGWSPVTLDGLATSCGLAPRELAVVIARLESEDWITCDGSWVERVHGR